MDGGREASLEAPKGRPVLSYPSPWLPQKATSEGSSMFVDPKPSFWEYGREIVYLI